MQIHLRDSRLALLHGRQTQQRARESRAAPVIEPELRRIPRGELVVAAILEEAPHRPRVPVEIAAKFYPVAATLPGVRVANFVHRVPGVHRSGCESISNSRVALHREPRRSPCVRPAESDPLNPQRTYNVVHTVV